MRKIKIAPSVLAYDPANLRGAVEIAEKGKADVLHLDVIDGHFAPNITFGAATVASISRETRLPIEAHLMIDLPRVFVHQFIDAGAEILIFHVEALDSTVFDALAALIHGKKKQIGLALKPETELPAWAEERLGRLARILILTVNPGFSGQRLDTRVLPKIEKISKLVDEQGLDVDVEVDGGIGAVNVGDIVARGGNVIVAGVGIYGARDPVAEIQRIRDAAAAARGGK